MPTNKQVICRTTGLLDDDRVVQLISVKLVADSHAVMSLHFARNQTNSNNKKLKICVMTIRMRAILANRSVAVAFRPEWTEKFVHQVTDGYRHGMYVFHRSRSIDGKSPTLVNLFVTLFQRLNLHSSHESALT